MAGLRVGVIGFGSVGRLICRSLVKDGANVLVTDVNAGLQPAVRQLGAAWTTADLLREHLDVLVPAATGGLLTAGSVAACGATLIVGPANNQIADDSDEVAMLLRDPAITWIPDTVANAGGIIHAVCREELAFNEAQTNAKIDSIAVTTSAILGNARSRGITTLHAAREFAARPGGLAAVR